MTDFRRSYLSITPLLWLTTIRLTSEKIFSGAWGLGVSSLEAHVPAASSLSFPNGSAWNMALKMQSNSNILDRHLKSQNTQSQVTQLVELSHGREIVF